MADNPPAFPQQCADALGVGMVHAGMSLRDWFAGQALIALVNSTPSEALADITQGIRAGKPLAYGAYALADAMLAERGRELAKARAGEGSV